MPRKIAGNEINTIDESSAAMKMPSVVFDSAVQRYRSDTTGGVPTTRELLAIACLLAPWNLIVTLTSSLEEDLLWRMPDRPGWLGARRVGCRNSARHAASSYSWMRLWGAETPRVMRRARIRG